MNPRDCSVEYLRPGSWEYRLERETWSGRSLRTVCQGVWRTSWIGWSVRRKLKFGRVTSGDKTESALLSKDEANKLCRERKRVIA